ncbi:MAG: PBSX family phage terminase large subunit, partial [Fusobacteriaceae bacterium]
MQVNDHFHDFIFDWDSKFYFLVGGYGSSKSYNTAAKLILKLAQEKRKALVVRQVFDTLRDTCFSLLSEVIESVGLSDVCKVTSSPMKIKFSNGSEIIFKGCDKPEKLKSLNGVSIVWLEESPEISYKAFKELLGRLRTKESVHFLLSNNPVSENSWTFKHFFSDIKLDPEILYKDRILIKGNTYYHHSIVDDNFFASEEYRETLEEYKIFDPDLYRIARLGRFGQLGTKVLNNVNVGTVQEVMDKVNSIGSRWKLDGMDFGFSVSFNAFVRTAIDIEKNILYVYDDFYNKGLINKELTDMVVKKVIGKYHNITADSSRPELIEEIKRSGVRIKKTKKGPGSKKEGIQKLRSFNEIIVSEN